MSVLKENNWLFADDSGESDNIMKSNLFSKRYLRINYGSKNSGIVVKFNEDNLLDLLRISQVSKDIIDSLERILFLSKRIKGRSFIFLDKEMQRKHKSLYTFFNMISFGSIAISSNELNVEPQDLKKIRRFFWSDRSDFLKSNINYEEMKEKHIKSLYYIIKTKEKDLIKKEKEQDYVRFLFTDNNIVISEDSNLVIKGDFLDKLKVVIKEFFEGEMKDLIKSEESRVTDLNLCYNQLIEELSSMKWNKNEKDYDFKVYLQILKIVTVIKFW